MVRGSVDARQASRGGSKTPYLTLLRECTPPGLGCKPAAGHSQASRKPVANQPPVTGGQRRALPRPFSGRTPAAQSPSLGMHSAPLTDDERYAALLARDPAHDGRWVVGVRSTKIFCRSTCPARKPRREQCTFYGSSADAMAAGFRACKRCHPLEPSVGHDPLVLDLLARHESEPERRWTEDEIAALGYDPSTVRRAFRRQFGQTFLAYTRQARVGRALRHLAHSNRVIDAQLTAGFESASGFRDAFARLLGVAPQDLVRSHSPLRADWIDTPLGPMLAVASATQLHLLEFVDRRALPRELRTLAHGAGGAPQLGVHPPIEQVREELNVFFAGRGAAFTTPLAMAGTPFTRTVWRALLAIPPGETRSYADIARAINRPTAVRAVARANGANQLAIIVPCHRVIGADGSLTGYAGGLWRKQRLITLEAAYGAQRELLV